MLIFKAICYTIILEKIVWNKEVIISACRNDSDYIDVAQHIMSKCV